jgi:hypothetical protein
LGIISGELLFYGLITLAGIKLTAFLTALIKKKNIDKVTTES